MAERPLPELRQADLDAAELRALVDDLAAHASVRAVVARGAAGAPGDGGPVELDRVPALLGSGAVRAVQVRYTYQGAEWVDTLTAGGGGVRLIRMRQEVTT